MPLSASGYSLDMPESASGYSLGVQSGDYLTYPESVQAYQSSGSLGSTASQVPTSSGASMVDTGSSSSMAMWPSLSDGMWNAASMSMSIKQQRESLAQQQYQFDKTFEENKRQFGLNYALQEWAARHNMTFQQAQAEYNRQMGRFQMGEQAKTGYLNRLQLQQNMKNIQQDREKRERIGKAYSEGILRGLFGR